MSIEAIEAIDKFLHQRERGLSIAEIVFKCEEFIKKRDANEHYNATRRYGDYNVTRAYYIREGKKIPREKVLS